ncbi:hypothetical protein B0H11DRAFT_2075999 [Mycena galericulata]|nr:hypothetical protein B0H11DRAFT_2075999 [Mycena galericulata]
MKFRLRSLPTFYSLAHILPHPHIVLPLLRAPSHASFVRMCSLPLPRRFLVPGPRPPLATAPIPVLPSRPALIDAHRLRTSLFRAPYSLLLVFHSRTCTHSISLRPYPLSPCRRPSPACARILGACAPLLPLTLVSSRCPHTLLPFSVLLSHFLTHSALLVLPASFSCCFLAASARWRPPPPPPFPPLARTSSCVTRSRTITSSTVPSGRALVLAHLCVLSLL